MVSVEEKILKIQEELDKTPRNKGTEHHIGKLKARLARLKEKNVKKKGKGSYGYSVKKTGDATVVLVGHPSIGKSTLLNALTNAESKVADYEFTTLEIIPGILEYKGARIQMLDIPGLIGGAASGKGRGREILGVIRNADLVLIMIDISSLDKLENIKDELEKAGIRLNKKPPLVKIRKKIKGGIIIHSSLKLTGISNRTIKSILNEYSIHNAEITIQEVLEDEDLIDSIMKNRVYVPMFVVVNKIDLGSSDSHMLKDDCIKISASKNLNIEKLKEKIFDKLGFIRVYTKPHGKEVNYTEPLIIKKNSTVLDFCCKIHKDFAKDFDFARVWGSTKFPGQRVGLNYILQNEDVIQVNFKK